MIAVLWLVLGLSQLVAEVRRLGPAGRERFRRLDEARARAVHEQYAGDAFVFLTGGAVALSVLGGLLGAADGSVTSVTLWGAAAGLLIAALVVHEAVKPGILEEFDARGLHPLWQRENSAQRRRRQLQFGSGMLIGFAASEIAAYLAERLDQPWLFALAGLGVALATVSLVGWLWSTAWRYGDETPA